MKKLYSALLVSLLSSSLVVACPCDNMQKQVEIKEKIALADKVFQLEPSKENLDKLTELKMRLAELEEESANTNND